MNSNRCTVLAHCATLVVIVLHWTSEHSSRIRTDSIGMKENMVRIELIKSPEAPVRLSERSDWKQGSWNFRSRGDASDEVLEKFISSSTRDADEAMMSSGTFPVFISDFEMMRVCRFLKLRMGLYDSRLERNPGSTSFSIDGACSEITFIKPCAGDRVICQWKKHHRNRKKRYEELGKGEGEGQGSDRGGQVSR